MQVFKGLVKFTIGLESIYKHSAKLILTATLLLQCLFFSAQAQNIPDANFAAAIRAKCSTCIDGSNNLLINLY